MEFLGDRGAAQHAAALEHAHLEAGAGEVRGAGEAVVAAADDDGVEARASRCHGVRSADAQTRIRLLVVIPAATIENPQST